jgi:hypothetical protein
MTLRDTDIIVRIRTPERDAAPRDPLASGAHPAFIRTVRRPSVIRIPRPASRPDEAHRPEEAA